MDKISVIVPVYNVGPYIRECLRSIQQQSYKELEVVLVDDGSTDGSGKICDEFSAVDRRFCVLHKDNGGVSSARNAGIDMMSGQYIAFLDPDDHIAKEYFEILHDAMLKQSTDLSVSGTKTIKEDGSPMLPKVIQDFFLGKGEVFEDNAAVIGGILKNRINCLSWGKLVKRELWGNARYPVNLTLGEDMATVVDVCAGASSAVYCPEAIYYYRQREKSLLHGTVTLERFYEDLCGSGIMEQKLLRRAPEKAGNIQLLKLLYDLGCYVNFIQSSEYTGEAEDRKGSRLYRLMSHVENFKLLHGSFAQTHYAQQHRQ